MPGQILTNVTYVQCYAERGREISSAPAGRKRVAHSDSRGNGRNDFEFLRKTFFPRSPDQCAR